MLGYIVSVMGAAILTDIVAGVVIFPHGWNSAFSLIDYLTSQRVNWLVYTGGWIGVCFGVTVLARKWFKQNYQMKVFSPIFLLVWVNMASAVISGFIIKTWLVGVFSWNAFIDMLFVGLFWALAPTFAAFYNSYS